MKVLRLIILIMTVVLLPSCTQNNGHIGPLFGAWHLEDMTCDGEDFAQPAGTDTYWEFQGAVITVILAETMYESLLYAGTWEREGNILSLDFTHSGDSYPPGTGTYQSPYWMGFPKNEIIHLGVLSLDGSRMTLDWSSEEGKRYTYKFKKTW